MSRPVLVPLKYSPQRHDRIHPYIFYVLSLTSTRAGRKPGHSGFQNTGLCGV